MPGPYTLTQIPCLEPKYLKSIGYQEGGDIALKTIGLTVPLENHFYRDDGKVANREEMVRRAIKTYAEVGRPRQDALYLIGKNMQDPKYGSGGYVLGIEIVSKERSLLVSKILAPGNDKIDNEYTAAHEEAYVVHRLGKSSLFDSWFTSKGFNKVSTEELLRQKDGEEWLASAVGLVHLDSKGMDMTQINRFDNTNSLIHDTLFIYLRR